MVIPNLLLIAGTGNKSGKTTLACRVIGQFRNHGVMAIKITPHFHEATPGLIPLAEKEGYSIYEESDPGTNKDTSRMLRAGAIKVFFAKVTDNSLPEAFREIIKLVPSGTPLVCESPALRYFAEPGIFVIMISKEANNNKNISKLIKLPHVTFQLNDLAGISILPFRFSDGKWVSDNQGC